MNNKTNNNGGGEMASFRKAHIFGNNIDKFYASDFVFAGFLSIIINEWFSTAGYFLLKSSNKP